MVRARSWQTGTLGTGGVPRWPGMVAALVVGALYLFIADRYAVGPPWLVLVAAAILLVALTLARVRGYHGRTHLRARALHALLTLVVAGSAALLVRRLAQGETQALALLREAALIWGATILTCAFWYGSVDGGGPARRHPGRHASVDFAFPQQQQAEAALVEGWSPGPRR